MKLVGITLGLLAWSVGPAIGYGMGLAMMGNETGGLVIITAAVLTALFGLALFASVAMGTHSTGGAI